MRKYAPLFRITFSESRKTWFCVSFFPKTKHVAKMNRRCFIVSKVIATMVFLLFIFVSPYLTKKEKSLETLFLENVMLREWGLYVLMGSKPMSEFRVNKSCPYEEGDIRSRYLRYVETLNGLTDFIWDIPTLSEYRFQCKSAKHQHSDRLWDAWRRQESHRASSKFLFIVRTDKGYTGGFFINVPRTIAVLERHYSSFSEVYGKAFEPDLVMKEIRNSESPFWSAVINDHVTFGLLFGYGERNSRRFSTYVNGEIDDFSQEGMPDIDMMIFLQEEKNISLSNLTTPIFRSFLEKDPVHEQYCRERDQILEAFNGRDFIEEVQRRLNLEEVQT